jgi:hypothetical protein
MKTWLDASKVSVFDLAALGSAAQGQRSEQIVQANIPFDFAVGSRFFPAGTTRWCAASPGNSNCEIPRAAYW